MDALPSCNLLFPAYMFSTSTYTIPFGPSLYTKVPCQTLQLPEFPHHQPQPWYTPGKRAYPAGDQRNGDYAKDQLSVTGFPQSDFNRRLAAFTDSILAAVQICQNRSYNAVELMEDREHRTSRCDG